MNEHELYAWRTMSLFPTMGQSVICQYQLEGNFNMLPFKFFPTFLPKHSVGKLEVTLKAQCKLPETQRAKYFRVTFIVPPTVTKVWFTNLQ